MHRTPIRDAPSSMDSRLTPLRTLLALNTRLFLNCLDGMDDAAALARPSGSTNSAAFVAAHLVDSRAFLAGLLGPPVESPFRVELEGARGIDDVRALPSVDRLRAAWRELSALVDGRLAAATADALDARSATRFPVDDGTVLGALAFLLQHDSYHIGQLALLRKYAGLPGMTYR